jgi:hypothetical protein
VTRLSGGASSERWATSEVRGETNRKPVGLRPTSFGLRPWLSPARTVGIKQRTVSAVTELSPIDRPTRDDLAPVSQQMGELPDSAALVPASPVDPPWPRSERWLWITAAVVVVVVVVVGSAPYLTVPWHKDEAVERCQVAIKEKLKPSLAKFGQATVTRDGSDPGLDLGSYYKVSGPVEVQDGSGAMVRGEYLCNMSREPNGSWVIPTPTVAYR